MKNQKSKLVHVTEDNEFIFIKTNAKDNDKDNNHDNNYNYDYLGLCPSNFHREDGPAIIQANGTKYWFLNDMRYPFEDWLRKTSLSEKEKVKLKLKYAPKTP